MSHAVAGLFSEAADKACYRMLHALSCLRQTAMNFLDDILSLIIDLLTLHPKATLAYVVGLLLLLALIYTCVTDCCT